MTENTFDAPIDIDLARWRVWARAVDAMAVVVALYLSAVAVTVATGATTVLRPALAGIAAVLFVAGFVVARSAARSFFGSGSVGGGAGTRVVAASRRARKLVNFSGFVFMVVSLMSVSDGTWWVSALAVALIAAVANLHGAVFPAPALVAFGYNPVGGQTLSSGVVGDAGEQGLSGFAVSPVRPAPGAPVAQPGADTGPRVLPVRPATGSPVGQGVSGPASSATLPAPPAVLSPIGPAGGQYESCYVAACRELLGWGSSGPVPPGSARADEFLDKWLPGDLGELQRIAPAAFAGTPAELMAAYAADGPLSPKLVYQTQMALIELSCLADQYYAARYSQAPLYTDGVAVNNKLRFGAAVHDLPEEKLLGSPEFIGDRLNDRLRYFTELFGEADRARLVHAAVIVAVESLVEQLRTGPVEFTSFFERVLLWSALNEVARRRLSGNGSVFPSDDLYPSHHAAGGLEEVNDSRLLLCGEDIGPVFTMDLEALNDQLILMSMERDHWHLSRWFDTA